MKISAKNVTRMIAAAAVSLALNACGGSGSDPAPVSEDTDLLIQNAAKHTAQNLGVNMTGATAMVVGSTIGDTMSKLGKVTDTESRQQAKYDETVRDHITPTLEGGNTTRSRNGNTVTIDPDERLICEQWVENQNTVEMNECTTVLSDLTVELTATSDDTGTLRYLYSNQNLITIGYAPAAASYEVFLPGLKTLSQRVTEVTGELEELPDTMQGAIKLSATVDNANEGQEAGTVSVSISQPLHIANTNENYSLKLGESMLFSIRSNAATGDGRFSTNINALQFYAENVLGSDPAAITRANLPEFSLTADLERSGTQVLLSNVGMGRGPFTMSINDSEIINVALQKFSARYNDLTRQADFISDFNLQLAFNYSQAAFGWVGDDSTIRVVAAVLAGTTLTEQPNGATQVTSGHPMRYQHSLIDGTYPENSFEQDSIFTVGQCFDESFDHDGLEEVSCE